MVSLVLFLWETADSLWTMKDGDKKLYKNIDIHLNE